MIRIIPCEEHGTSAWCYVVDERHVDSEECRCYWTTCADCPVHRESISVNA